MKNVYFAMTIVLVSYTVLKFKNILMTPSVFTKKYLISLEFGV
jgi:hypothetical protein